MPASFDLTQLIALAAALGFASGIRLYAVVLAVGLAGALGWVELPGGLSVLTQPWVIGLTGIFVALEFLADKIPGIDTVWDSLSTFIRIPGGALLAASVFGFDQTTAAAIAAVLGGSLAATGHFAKASARAAINTSPEPISNVAASTAEDAGILGLVWLAFAHPVTAIATVALMAAASAWLIFKFIRLVRRLLARRSP
ncbi:MAG: DUF4126 domain-containing protein [Burkholderiaceae bacterium]